MSPMMRFAPLVLLQLISLPTYSTAYSWVFNSAPKQCSNISISITGSGTPPYRVLIIPFGPTPLPNDAEVRHIIDHQFDGNATSTSFAINYPENSQFVAVVSDSTGFGTGGTSVAAQVTTSGDSSCYNASAQVAPLYDFYIDPQNQIVECSATRIWWDNSTVQGTPSFVGVIPGGQSFTIPESNITNLPSEGTGFSWTPSIRGGTTLVVVGGDNRGAGTGGSAFYVVSAGGTNCLSALSPSSTPGSPAGGSYPTGASGSTSGGGSSGGTNIGAIVGGVIAAVALIVTGALFIYYLRRRERFKRRQKDRAVDLLNAEDDEDDHPPAQNAALAAGSRSSQNDLPEFYRPEPYLVSESDTRTDALSLSAGRRTPGYESRRLSGTTTEMSQFGFDPTTPSSTGRKGPAPRQWRAVNIVQHEDAGPSGPPPVDGEEAETIELPPAYTHIRTTSS